MLKALLNLIRRPSEGVAAKKPNDKKRSGKWPRVRANHLVLHPVCEGCGAKNDLNVHHVQPFHVDHSKELDPTNLITLCEGPVVRQDAPLFRAFMDRIKAEREPRKYTEPDHAQRPPDAPAAQA